MTPTTSYDPAAPDVGARETPWTPGPYLRVNATVYALTESGGWRNGKPDMCNRFTAFVQSGARCRQGEDEATAQLFAAAPELYAALTGMVALFDAENGIKPIRDYERTAVSAAVAALASATAPTPSDAGRDHGEAGK